MNVPEFPSLADLQTRHSALVRDVGRDLLDAANLDRIVKFVRACVAAGAVLEIKEDRAAAQEVIGFWTARVATAAREQARAARRDKPSVAADAADLPDFGNTLLEPYDSATLKDAVATADGWANDLLEGDKTLVRRVLMRMTRLAADGAVVLTPVRRESLDDLEPRERVDELLRALVTHGLVRRSTRAGQAEEFTLQSVDLLKDWAFLRAAVHQRKEFRARVTAWKASGKPSGRKYHFWRFVRRQLLSIGKRMDHVWELGLRALGAQAQFPQDPLQDVPDVDYYRDRTLEEMDYLFDCRAEAKEGQEWFRVVKGLVLMGVLVAVVAGAIVFLQRRAELAVFESEKNRQLEKAKADASRNEIVKRRARQRLKEHHNLVRLLAEHRQFDNARDYPRARAAKGQLETPLYADTEEEENYRDEWGVVGIVYRTDDRGIVAACSGSPLDIARKLRDLVQPRLIPPGQPGHDKDIYDPDTVIYLDYLKSVYYRTTRKLVQDLSTALKGNEVDGRTPTYNAVADFMGEFWILYYGDMVLVESGDVEGLMIKFKDAMVRVDGEFEKALTATLAAAGVTDKTAPGGEALANWTTAAKSFAWRSEAKPDALVGARAAFLRKPISALPPNQQTDMAKAIAELNEVGEALNKKLREELGELPPPPAANAANRGPTNDHPLPIRPSAR